MSNNTEQIVEKYYEAWRTGDTNKFLFADDFKFDGPIASLANPDEFRAMAAQFSPMVKAVKILDSIYDNDKAFVLLDFETNVPQVGNWIASDYFVIEKGKIKYGRTTYDPRKLVEFMQSR